MAADVPNSVTRIRSRSRLRFALFAAGTLLVSLGAASSSLAQPVASVSSSEAPYDTTPPCHAQQSFAVTTRGSTTVTHKRHALRITIQACRSFSAVAAEASYLLYNGGPLVGTPVKKTAHNVSTNQSVELTFTITYSANEIFAIDLILKGTYPGGATRPITVGDVIPLDDKANPGGV